MYVNVLHWDELERITGKKKTREKLIDSETEGIPRYFASYYLPLLPLRLYVYRLRILLGDTLLWILFPRLTLRRDYGKKDSRLNKNKDDSWLEECVQLRLSICFEVDLNIEGSK